MWDAETMFSNEQTLAAGNSDNIIDTGAKDAGKGHPLHLTANIGEGASGALAIALKTSSAGDMSGARTVADYHVSADKVAKGGVVLVADLPTGCDRYLQLAYTGATGGVITAGLTLGGETSQM